MKSIFTLLFITLLTTPLSAKELTDRVGIGYSNAFISDSDVPSVQAKYTPLRDLSFVGALGVDTSDDGSSLGFLAKVQKIIFHEANLNFYLAGHGAFVSNEVTVTVNGVKKSETDTGVEFAALCGAEFFIPGLENLGISFEAGFGITTAGEGVTFKTVALHPLRAGMIFYF